MRKFIIFLLLSMSCFIAACTQSSAETDEITQIIEEELGISPYIPDNELIGAVIMDYNMEMDGEEAERGDPYSVEISYKVSTEEKVDDEMMEAWEERDLLSEIIYGDLYMDPDVSSVTIFKGGAGEIMDAELLEIEGKEVQYQYKQAAIDVVIMAIDFEDYGYSIVYYLEDGRTEEDAKAFAGDIIRNVE